MKKYFMISKIKFILTLFLISNAALASNNSVIDIDQNPIKEIEALHNNHLLATSIVIRSKLENIKTYQDKWIQIVEKTFPENGLSTYEKGISVTLLPRGDRKQGISLFKTESKNSVIGYLLNFRDAADESKNPLAVFCNNAALNSSIDLKTMEYIFKLIKEKNIDINKIRVSFSNQKTVVLYEKNNQYYNPGDDKIYSGYTHHGRMSELLSYENWLKKHSNNDKSTQSLNEARLSKTSIKDLIGLLIKALSLKNYKVDKIGILNILLTVQKFVQDQGKFIPIMIYEQRSNLLTYFDPFNCDELFPGCNFSELSIDFQKQLLCQFLALWIYKCVKKNILDLEKSLKLIINKSYEEIFKELINYLKGHGYESIEQLSYNLDDRSFADGFFEYIRNKNFPIFKKNQTIKSNSNNIKSKIMLSEYESKFEEKTNTGDSDLDTNVDSLSNRLESSYIPITTKSVAEAEAEKDKLDYKNSKNTNNSKLTQSININKDKKNKGSISVTLLNYTFFIIIIMTCLSSILAYYLLSNEVKEESNHNINQE